MRLFFTKKERANEFFYQNVNLDTTKEQKRVLVSYVTYPFSHAYSECLSHTLALEIPLIIKSFIDNDCVVDIIECTNSADITKVAKKKYDCIFGFGEPWVVAVKK